jgi:DNA-binding protein H-NS
MDNTFGSIVMAKTGSIDRREVKNWFAGLSFEAQQSVLDDFEATFQASKEQRIGALEKELATLRGRKPEGGTVPPKRGSSPKKGVKVPPKYRDANGNTWAGRGVQPTWLRDYLKKRGNKLEDLLIKK